MDDKFDNADSDRDVMYESFESRYATELVNCEVTGDKELSVSFTDGVFKDAGYLDGSSAIYMIVDGKRYCLAMQNGTEYDGAEWFFSNVKYSEPGGVVKSLRVAKIEGTKPSFKVTLEGELPSEVKYVAVGRYDSERDLTGKYLGEVELQVRDYHFRPRPVSLGVTWTQLAEITLDTSYGVSTEEMLLDFAAQEIKKTLDFQAVKMASSAQRTYTNNTVTINAQPADAGGIKDSYWHTAQLVGQAINRVGDLQLNEFNRGGVTAIVGGPAAVEYLKLSTVWKDTGRQAPIGGHKCGEFDGKIWNAIVKVA